MAWSGSTYRKGNYSTNGWTGDAANSIGIEAGRHDIQDDDFAQGITDCINKNGLNSPSTNLSMGGFRHTNVAQAASGTDYSRFDQVIDRAGTQAATANLPMGGFKHTNVAVASSGTDYARFDQVMDRAGTQAATANISMGSNKITNLANGTASTDAATYGQLTTTASTNTPVGVINIYAGSSAPTGWELCNGASKSTTGTYAALFAVIGYTYGGSGANFNLPDLQQKFPLGKAASGTGSSLGGTGGSINHTHIAPPHYHGIGAGATLAVDIAHSHGSSSVSGTVGGSDGTHYHSLDVTGGGTPNTANLLTRDATTRGRATGYTGVPATTSDGGHGHGFSLTAAGQTLSTTSVTPTGTIGLVTGGVNGNSTTAMVTDGANPPYLVINYIIKI